MSHISSLLKISAISIFVYQSFLSTPAFAAGFQINEISPSLQGNAMAGAAAAEDDVSAMFINPATLSNLKHNQAYLGGSEILPHVSMKDATATHTVNVPGSPPSAITATVRGVNAQNGISKPAFIPDGYFGWRINDKFVVGLALSAPFGLTTKYYLDSVLRFAAVNSGVKTTNLTPSLSFQLNQQWAFGLGFQAQFLNADFSNFNGPYTGTAIDPLIAADNPTTLSGSGWGYGFTTGAIYTPDEQTRIGLGYRSQVSTQLSGNGQQYLTPGGVVPAPNPAFPFNAQTDVSARVKTPAILTLSAARDMNQWTVKATAQVNFWKSFNQLSVTMHDAYGTNSTIYTKWKNAIFLALGADYRASQSLTARAGIAYDQTPSNKTYRDARIPDSDRYWANIGATYVLNKHISFDGAYSHLFSPSQSINVTQASGTTPASAMPGEINTVTAKYSSSVDIIALAFRYSF